nr:hypothetical protein BaRGS_000977 [Batillaria attramentaria]
MNVGLVLPAGRLIWFSEDTVLAVGQYGVTSLQFPADKTPTKCDVSFQMTCQVDWIIKENISVTTFVACTSQDALSSRRLQQIVIGVEVGLVLVLALCGLLIILWHRQTLTSQLTPGVSVTRDTLAGDKLQEDVTAAGHNSSHSVLTMSKIERERAGTVACSDGVQTAYCSLDVQRK